MQENSILEIKKYLKKLTNVINKDHCFAFFSKRLYNKKRIDDLLCCIEASFPTEYKNYIKTQGSRNLRSYQSYTELVKTLHSKFILSSDYYFFPCAKAISIINCFSQLLDSDIKKVNESIQTMS